MNELQSVFDEVSKLLDSGVFGDILLVCITLIISYSVMNLIFKKLMLSFTGREVYKSEKKGKNDLDSSPVVCSSDYEEYPEWLKEDF